MNEAARDLIGGVTAEIGHLTDEVQRLEARNEQVEAAVQRANAGAAAARELYLNLMEYCITNVIYEDPPLAVLGSTKFDRTVREYGRDWPSKAHSMIGLKRIANLRREAERVIKAGIPGDFIETGVWRGGASILMRAVLKAHGVSDRRIWVADSFQGLPAPDARKYPADKKSILHTYRELAVPLDEVKSNFSKYGLLDEQVVFLKGWFKDTLPRSPIKSLALLRLDGDMYESTLDVLAALYDRLSASGSLIVDDYHVVPACRKAVDEFRVARGIKEPLRDIDGLGVFWVKSPVP